MTATAILPLKTSMKLFDSQESLNVSPVASPRLRKLDESPRISQKPLMSRDTFVSQGKLLIDKRLEAFVKQQVGQDVDQKLFREMVQKYSNLDKPKGQSDLKELLVAEIFFLQYETMKQEAVDEVLFYIYAQHCLFVGQVLCDEYISAIECAENALQNSQNQDFFAKAGAFFLPRNKELAQRLLERG